MISLKPAGMVRIAVTLGLCSVALPQSFESQVAAQIQPLTQNPLVVQSGAELGWAVDVSGNIVALGAPFEDVGGFTDAGACYIFERDDNGTPNLYGDDSWATPIRIENPSPGDEDLFGLAVALDDDVLVVGAFWDDSNGVNSGSAYVYHRDGGTWCPPITLQPASAQPGDLFGRSVAVSGGTVVVGAIGVDTPAGSAAGAAYVFTRTQDSMGDPCGDTYTERQVLEYTCGSPGPNDNFGHSVAIDGGVIVVGAYLDDVGPNVDQGSVAVFQMRGTQWECQSILASDGSADDQFGWEVAVSGLTVVVGAAQTDFPFSDAGSAYVFDSTDGQSWTPAIQLTLDPQAVGGPGFGRTVDTDGEIVLVGRHTQPFGALDGVGAIYVYERSAIPTFGLTDTLIGCQGAQLDVFGSRARIDGRLIVGGAPGVDGVRAQDDTRVRDSGAAYVFELTIPEPFDSFCAGDGDPAVPGCPCGNESVPGQRQGCNNSTGRGARIFGLASADVIVGDLQVSACNLPGSSSAVLFSGTVGTSPGAHFGDGLRCVEGTVRRLGALQADTNGDAIWGPELRGDGQWVPGDTRYLQVWYRDPFTGPCGGGFSVSNGLRVVFHP